MVKALGAQRESDWVVVPVIGVQQNAPGGKDPDFDHAWGVVWRLRRLMIKKRVRNLRAGQTLEWTEDWFNTHGRHRLRGAIRYPKAA